MDSEYTVEGFYEIENKDQIFLEKKDNFLTKNIIPITITILLLLFTFLVILPKITITINAGEKGVLFKRIFGQGVELDTVYDEGLHFVFPWNIMTPYSIRIQNAHQNMTVLSQQGMKISLKVSVRYHPKIDTLAYLHQNIGPDYANTIILPEVHGIVLSVFGNQNLEYIYTNIYDLIASAKNNLAEQMLEKEIIIDDLIVKHIELPSSVKSAINEKIKHRQTSLGYKYILETASQEAERKTIEAKGIQSFQSIVSEGISENYLKWKGIDATLKLATSNNSKVVVIGSAKDGLPLILNTDSNVKQSSVKDTNTTSL